MPQKMIYDCAMQSDVGTRDEQQDYADSFESNGKLIAVVCDGMGGLKAGDIAGKTAVSKLIDEYKKKNNSESVHDFLLRMVDIMDESVSLLMDEERKKLRAGTTVVSAIIEDDGLYWLSVGDSRLYIFRNGEFIQATRDHNYFLSINQMPEGYVPTEEEIANGEALISFIGMGGVEIMDISEFPLPLINGDVLLLTTDGLYKSLSDDEIKNIVKQSGTSDEAAHTLIEASVVASDSRDNTTVIIIKIGVRQ